MNLIRAFKLFVCSTSQDLAGLSAAAWKQLIATIEHVRTSKKKEFFKEKPKTIVCVGLKRSLQRPFESFEVHSQNNSNNCLFPPLSASLKKRPKTF